MPWTTAASDPTSPIPDSFVAELIRCRASYSYPRAYLQACPQDESDLTIASGLFAKCMQPLSGEVTDNSLDEMHYNLLHDEAHASNQLLGVASIIYWGFYSHTHQYAKNRVFWFLHGRPRSAASAPTTAADAHERLEVAFERLASKDLGEALGALRGLNELNRTPFASKIIAFAAPSIAGVYDRWIGEGLNKAPWGTWFSNGVGPTTRRPGRDSYAAWCLLLRQLASQINLGISLGKSWCWYCGKDVAQQWRAIDVERSLFSMFKDGVIPIGQDKWRIPVDSLSPTGDDSVKREDVEDALDRLMNGDHRFGSPPETNE